MMFRTEIKIDKAPFEIDHSTKIVSIGSCFANMIGNRFKTLKFNVQANPFGIIYDPISQCRLFGLREIIDREESYYSRDGVVFNHYLHSDIFETSIDGLKGKIEQLA
ncbi:MAG TPA: GSCFA domain-containing protein, partial [Cytophagaceae bacterium]